jgi:hypothetical protein
MEGKTHSTDGNAAFGETDRATCVNASDSKRMAVEE